MAEHLSVTPTGVAILHEDGEPDPATGAKKWRSYRVCQLPDRLVEDDGAALEFTREHATKLPSVTTILGATVEKPGLQWAAARLTVAGCIELARNGGLPQDPEAAWGALYRNELTFRQVWDSKGDRGKMSHQDLVGVADGKVLRPMGTYAEEDRGFIQGVAAFLSDLRPEIHESEVMVASVENGYAGRYDLVATLGAEKFRDGTPTPQGRGLLDLKTHERLPRTKPSNKFPQGQLKTPYPENFLQLGLYEIARRECGLEATDWQAIVTVDANGGYDFTCSWLQPEAALDFLPAYRTFKLAGSRVKRPADQLPVGLHGKAAA